jgi:hypothetical protein
MKRYIKANDENMDYGYGFTSNGEPIDESTVDELYRIASEILEKSVITDYDRYASIEEDTFEYYATGSAWGANLDYVIRFEATGEDIDILDFLNTDIIDRYLVMWNRDGLNDSEYEIGIRVSGTDPEYNEYSPASGFMIECTNRDAICRANFNFKEGSYLSRYPDECINWDKLYAHIAEIVQPVIVEIHSTLSNI